MGNDQVAPVVPHRFLDPMSNQPAFRHATWTVFALIGALALIHGLRALLPDETDFFDLLLAYGFIPARLSAFLSPDGLRASLAEASAARILIAKHIVAQGPGWHTLATYALLHANLAHLVVNSVWLAAFGTAVARRFGALRFVIFCVVTAIAGALAHLAAMPFDTTLVIGASAIVSGAMGAAARFAFAPGAPLGGESAQGGRVTQYGDVQAYRGPRTPILAVFRNTRALTFVAVWMASNVIFAFATPGPELGETNIAWQAHIGGFFAGFFGIALFDRRPR